MTKQQLLDELKGIQDGVDKLMNYGKDTMRLADALIDDIVYLRAVIQKMEGGDASDD